MNIPGSKKMTWVYRSSNEFSPLAHAHMETYAIVSWTFWGYHYAVLQDCPFYSGSSPGRNMLSRVQELHKAQHAETYAQWRNWIPSTFDTNRENTYSLSIFLRNNNYRCSLQVSTALLWTCLQGLEENSCVCVFKPTPATLRRCSCSSKPHCPPCHSFQNTPMLDARCYNQVLSQQYIASRFEELFKTILSPKNTRILSASDRCPMYLMGYDTHQLVFQACSLRLLYPSAQWYIFLVNKHMRLCNVLPSFSCLPKCTSSLPEAIDVVSLVT